MFANRLLRPLLSVLALAAGLAPAASAQSLRASPFSVSVYFQRNTPSGNSVLRTLEITNINTRVQVETTSDGPSNVNWLFVNQRLLNANEGATRQVNITILPGALSPGSYTGTVRFTPDGGLPLVVPVTVVVSDLRMQNPVPSSLEFVLQRNSPRTQPLLINVTATSGTLNITASGQTSPTSWLLVDPGVATPGSIGASALGGDLPPGEYTGSITLVATGNANETLGNPTITIPVRLRVVDDNRLSVAPTALNFDFQLGGPVPAARTASVSSTGSPLDFTIEIATPGTNINWLTVAPLLGVTPQNLTIGLQNLANLPAGTFIGTATVKTTNNQSVVITVTLRVAIDPLLTVNPGQLTFTYQLGGPQPPRQTLIASNFGNPVSLTVQPSASTWLTVSTPAAATPAAIVIGVNTTNLPPGTYDGQVEIRGAFGNGPLQVPVKLVVGASNQPLLRVGQNQLDFAFQTGSSTASLSQAIEVTSTGAAVQYTATAVNGAGWLAVTSATPQATPNPATVTVTPGSLPPGVYTAQVSLLATELNAVPIVVPVRMVISIVVPRFQTRQ